MKYKRRSLKPAGHTAHSNRNATGKGRSSLHRKAVVSGMIIMLLFSVTKVGIVERTAITRFLDSSAFESNYITGEKTKLFLDKLGSLISEFCFGYLRSEKKEGKAFATDSEKAKENQEIHDLAVASSGVNPDAVTEPEAENIESSKENTFTEYEEPVSFEPSMPCNGEITSAFGRRIHPVTGEASNHNGIDIACNQGTTVSAVFDGTVEKSEYNQYSGNFIVIRHDNGFTSSYAHLSERLVQSGKHVEKGSVIAKSGSTGMVTGPHLHFELRLNGVAVNPLDYISGD